jgi:oxalate decarboxylase/phosphoglucose isomerase-like protein (cupin superfamily)
VVKIDLTEQMGLPSELDAETGVIQFGVTSDTEILRTLRDLRDLGVLHYVDEIPTEAFSRPITNIYRMLNDGEVRKLQGLAADGDDGIKFDITVLHSHRQLGVDWRWEYPKTSGHYHTALPGSEYASPDFYQVVSGEGAIILQSRGSGGIQTKIVRVAQGDTLMIAPELGHTSINLGETPLVFANICVRRPHLNYADIHRYRGAPYLLIRDTEAPDAVRLEENPGYRAAGLDLSSLSFVETNWEAMAKLHVCPKRPLYEYINDPFVTEMLCLPDRYHDVMVDALRSA